MSQETQDRRVIWKFPLDRIIKEGEMVPGEVGIVRIAVADMPVGAWVLYLANDNKTGLPALWALCNPSAPLEQRRFTIYPTGSHFTLDDKGWNYIGSFQSGPFVWHIAEAS